MSERIQIDDLDLEIRRSARRRHVGITVERDGGVVMAVPEKMGRGEISRIARQKQSWIYATIGKREESEKGPPPKEYVSGEGFYYLGRKFRLKLLRNGTVKDAGEGLKLLNGRLVLPRELAPQGRELFMAWYSEKAEGWITERIEMLKGRVAAAPKAVGIRDLGFRWGSCTHKGKIFFHWRTILLPPERIDYLILHELVHIHEHNHSPAFYERLRRAVPDYKAQEAWFLKHGDLYRL